MTKLSEFPLASSLNGTERIPFARSGTNLHLTLPLLRNYGLGEIDLTAGEIASPSAPILANLDATYRLNVAPHTRYYSTGTALVPSSGASEAFVNAGDAAAVASAVATAAAAAAALYLPGPVPDLATWLQDKVDASVVSGMAVPADWVWGNYVIPAPIVVTISEHLNGFRFDGHGAKFTVGFNDDTQDLIKFYVPDGSTAQINGLSIANMMLDGSGAALPRKVKNCLTISCKMGASSIFGSEIDRVSAIGAKDSGILLYGNVFEFDLISCLCRDNDRAGLELRNPTAAAGTGVISSIKVIGGDYRTNKYGIMTSAETTYQEAGGIHITDADFISNLSAGVFAFAGAAGIDGCHFENNCGSNAGETDGAIWNVFGPIKIDNCDATSSNSSPQIHLLDALGQVNQPCFISRSYSQNTDLGTFRQTAKLAGNGTMYLDPSMLISRFTLSGTTIWHFVNDAGARKPTRVTTATYTVLDTDTHIICDRAGTVTLTLPDPAKWTDRALKIKTVQAQAVVSATAIVVPLVGGAAVTNILAATAGKWADVSSSGVSTTTWEIMAAG